MFAANICSAARSAGRRTGQQSSTPIAASVAVLTWPAFTNFALSAEPSAPDLQSDILSLFKNRCVKCHGPAKQEGGLNLSLPSGIARGGESGAVVVPGKPDESRLWQLVDADEMPQDEPLGSDEKSLLRRWIAAGAVGLPDKVTTVPDGDEHWAFGRLHRPAPPPVRDASRVRTPLDAFVQAKLEAAGMSMNVAAGRRALIRRVAFDVTSLPPTPEELEAYLNDTDALAYEKMVDRYLVSSRYGERWSKYWLDAAGYADSNGYFAADTDRPQDWRYRDWVIRSIATDQPLDQFIREQLAGDEPARELKPHRISSPARVWDRFRCHRKMACALRRSHCSSASCG